MARKKGVDLWVDSMGTSYQLLSSDMSGTAAICEHLRNVEVERGREML